MAGKELKSETNAPYMYALCGSLATTEQLPLSPLSVHVTMATTENPLSRSCPYLDTISRSILDFDFEKLCSISLSTNNVYACLVCGKYFQGESSRSCDTAE